MSQPRAILAACLLFGCSSEPATEPRGSVDSGSADSRQESGAAEVSAPRDSGTAEATPADTAPEAAPPETEAAPEADAPSSVRCKVTSGKVYECGAGVFPDSGAHVSWNWEGKGQACSPTNYTAGTVPCGVGEICSVFIPSSTTLLGTCL